jgi:CRP-like cAMP-binding protein
MGATDVFDHLLRPELREQLKAGGNLIDAAMTSQTQLYGPKDIVVAAGGSQRGIYQVVSGWLAQKRTLPDGRVQIVAFLLPGDLFGVRAMLMDRAPDSIEALTTASVRMVGAARALELASLNFEFALRIIWHLVRADLRHHRWLVVLGQGNAMEKIAIMMLDLCERLRRAGLLRDMPPRLPIAQREIADHLGLTLPHVSRSLAAFRDRGMLNMHYRSIEITNFPALAEFARSIEDWIDRDPSAAGESSGSGDDPSRTPPPRAPSAN